MDVTGPYRTGALMLLIAAALQVVALVLGGGQFLVPLLLGAVLWLILAFGLFRGWRWLAYIAFLAAMAGTIMAMAFALGAHGLWGLSLWAVTLVDLVAVLALLGALWRSRPVPDPA